MNLLTIVGLLLFYLYIVGFLAAMYYSNGRQPNGIVRIWGLANVLALACFGAFLVDDGPYAAGALVARNVLLAAAAVSIVYSIMCAAGRTPNSGLLAGMLGLFSALIVYYALVEPDAMIRIQVLNVFACALAAYGIWELASAYVRQRNRHYLVLGGGFGVLIIAYMYRAVYTYSAVDLSVDLVMHHVLMVGILVNFAFLLLWNVVLYVLVSQEA